MGQLVLNAFAWGLDDFAQRQVADAFRWKGPTYLSLHWVERARCDLVFCSLETLRELPSAASRDFLFVAVTCADGAAGAWPVLQRHPSAMLFTPDGAVNELAMAVAQRTSALLLQQAIGLALSRDRAQLEPGASAYHLISASGGRVNELAGVVDMGRFVAFFSPHATPEKLADAAWIAKPSADSRLTLGFTAASLGSCMWHFAERSKDNFLPARYWHKMIFAKRTSSADAVLLRPEHVEVLELLRDEARTLEQLTIDTGWAQHKLAKVVEGLYIAGTVSTQPKAALQMVVRPSNPGTTHPFGHAHPPTEVPTDFPADESLRD